MIVVMLDKILFDGSDMVVASIAVLVVTSAIRYIALEAEIMKYITSPSPHLAPLLDMVRDRGRFLLGSMPGMFAALLLVLVSSAIYQALQVESASFATGFQLLVIGLAACASIQLMLENRLTLIRFTYQRSTTGGDDY